MLAACTTTPSATPLPSLSEEIVFGDATSLPVRVAEANGTLSTDGGVVSVRLVNLGTSGLTATGIEPIADDGLSVEYLGFSDCARGCPGALPWDDEAIERVEEGRDGRFPITLVPLDDVLAENDRTVRLMFRLTVPGDDGMDALLARCLHLRAILLETGSGSTLTVSAGEGHWVAAIRAPDPLPTGYQSCDAS